MSDGAVAPSLRERVRRLVERPAFSTFIITVIAINAVTLGLETWPAAMSAAGPALYAFDRLALAIYVVELAFKLYAYRSAFFRSGWNVFDLVIVVIALVPTSGPLEVLRAFRILRGLRLLSVVPEMRKVINALLGSVRGMTAIIAVLALVFYIAGVMTTKLFGETFPEWFGSIGGSMYTLFQVMTLESWSMGIVRPVMETFPLAWIFFVPFIVVTSFAVLNLFIALIVNSMQALHEEEMRAESDAVEARAHQEREAMATTLRNVERDITGAQAERDALAERLEAMQKEMAEIRRLLESRA